jgi:hypothetical protein
LRTHQCSLLEDLTESCQTLPAWGLMRDGECWERQTLVLRISETESGLLPNGETFFHTPNTTGMDGGSNSRKALKKRKYQWPTPCLPGNGGTNGKAKLKEMLKWPTPTAHNAKETNAPSEYSRNTPTLAAQAGGILNPTWVEKLMGWPDNWTALQPISHVTMCFWFMGFCDGEEAGRNEVMRVLRQGHAAQEIQRTIGRPVGVHEATFLLAELCKHANRPDEARVFMACAEALEEEMRGVRLCNGTTGAPHRPRQDEQRAGEHPDVMQALSRLLAYHGQAYWKDGRWEDATPRVANGVAARVDRLKAIGNGQVPAVAATAWKLLSET